MVRELLKLTAQPDIISFAGGLPGADLFPIDRFREACERVLSERGAQALQYSTTEGERPLREMIARHTSRYGIVINADNVLITSGSQQALDLIGKVFLNAGDHVLVERPTYLGVVSGGLLIHDSSVASSAPPLPSVRVYPVPLSTMARDLGQPMVKNIIALGALAGATRLLPEDTFRAALRQTFDGAPALLELNQQAFARGVRVTRQVGPPLV
jgi:hypothetical protein